MYTYDLHVEAKRLWYNILIISLLFTIDRPVWDDNKAPKNTSGVLGEQVTLVSSASTNPGSLNYTWYRNGVAIQRHTDLPHGNLVLKNLSLRDEGWYKSKATNGHLEIQGDAYLTVMSRFFTFSYLGFWGVLTR